MRSLTSLLAAGRAPRAIGFDDAPFVHGSKQVEVAGIVTAGIRFEGMVWGTATRDGDDATAVLAGLLRESKFAAQVHVVLIDGLAVGGFNLVDLPGLAAMVERPCIAVMRRPPNFAAISRALTRLPDADRRQALIERAGPVHGTVPCCFQVAGVEPEVAATTLRALTDRGNVPECLRLAHLIGGAVKTGQSGKRA